MGRTSAETPARGGNGHGVCGLDRVLACCGILLHAAGIEVRLWAGVLTCEQEQRGNLIRLAFVVGQARRRVITRSAGSRRSIVQRGVQDARGRHGTDVGGR